MSQPKSNEELIEEFRIVCPHTSPHCTNERCFGACSQDVYVDWVQTALAQKDAEVAHKIKVATIEAWNDAVELSDHLEESNTKFDEWRAFKGFRNALRDKIKELVEAIPKE